MRHVTLVSLAAVAFLLSCGGGGGSTEPSMTPGFSVATTTTTHSIRLGPIVGATVSIYGADCLSLMYKSNTDSNGNYSINVAQLTQALGTPIPQILCVESIGGKDVDPNDDGIRGETEAVAVQGKIRGYVRTVDLLTTNGTKINLFGSAIADLLGQSSDVSLARIEQLAAQLGVPDIDGDGKITIADVTRYEMGTKTNAEENLREIYLSSIHDGNDSDRKFFVDVTDSSIAAVRPVFASKGDGTGLITLIPYSRDGVIRYGGYGQNPLPNVYSQPVLAHANDIIFMQECRDDYCYPLQGVQVNSSATKFKEYADTGGIELSAFYANQKTQEELLAQIAAKQVFVDKAIADDARQSAIIQSAQSEIDRLQAENNALNTQIAQLQAGN